MGVGRVLLGLVDDVAKELKTSEVGGLVGGWVGLVGWARIKEILIRCQMLGALARCKAVRHWGRGRCCNRLRSSFCKIRFRPTQAANRENVDCCVCCGYSVLFDCFDFFLIVLFCALKSFM